MERYRKNFQKEIKGNPEFTEFTELQNLQKGNKESYC